MKPTSSALFLLLCIALCKWSYGQSADMNTWLNTGTDDQRMLRLMQLGVDKFPAEATLTSGIDVRVQWLTPKELVQQNLALLYLPCAIDSAYLHLLKKSDNAWHVIDRMEFDCHYDASVSATIGYVRSGQPEIFVHRACEGHGTGFVQQNFIVIDVRGDNLTTVLDTEEVLKSYQPPDHDLVQKSSFVIVSSSIEETRRIILNGKSKVERRTFRWSPAEQRYVDSKSPAQSLQKHHEQTGFGAEGHFERPVPLPAGALQAFRTSKVPEDLAREDLLAECAEDAGIQKTDVPATWFVASEIRLTKEPHSGLVVRGEQECLYGAHIAQFWVLAKSAEGYSIVFRGRGDGFSVLPTRTNGYRDLELTIVTFGGRDVDNIRFRYREGSYRLAGHKIYHNKV